MYSVSCSPDLCAPERLSLHNTKRSGAHVMVMVVLSLVRRTFFFLISDEIIDAKKMASDKKKEPENLQEKVILEN